MSKDRVRAFNIELARLAMAHQISPAVGMTAFGHLAGLMVAYELRRTGLELPELRENMMAMFTKALDAGIVDGTKNPPPIKPGRSVQ